MKYCVRHPIWALEIPCYNEANFSRMKFQTKDLGHKLIKFDKKEKYFFSFFFFHLQLLGRSSELNLTPPKNFPKNIFPPLKIVT